MFSLISSKRNTFFAFKFSVGYDKKYELSCDSKISKNLEKVEKIGLAPLTLTLQRFSRAGPRGRAREWATLGVHPLSWLLSNNRLEEVCGTLTKGTFSRRLLLSNQDKGCTPSVAVSLPLPLLPGFCSTCQLSLGWWGRCEKKTLSTKGGRKGQKCARGGRAWTWELPRATCRQGSPAAHAIGVV